MTANDGFLVREVFGGFEEERPIVEYEVVRMSASGVEAIELLGRFDTRAEAEQVTKGGSSR